LPATISLASAINTFKTNSSRFMHERGFAFQWQNGYGASAYLQPHLQHHRRVIQSTTFLAISL
jgi:hypothetical protein